MSNLMNKAKDMLRKDKSDKQDSNLAYGNDPYANTNPNVGGNYNNQGMGQDSNFGGHNNPNVGGGHGQQGMHDSSFGGHNNPNVGGGYGQQGNVSNYDNNPNVGGGYGQQGHPGSTNAGPHSSNMMNKMDPR